MTYETRPGDGAASPPGQALLVMLNRGQSPPCTEARHHQAESSFPSMLRRFSRLHRSQVQTCRPFSTPSAHVSRAASSSSGIRPHVVQASRVVSSVICPVSTRRAGQTSAHVAASVATVVTRVIEPCTARLRLRQWRDDDRTPFAALNADPLVMHHFPDLLTRDQSDAMVDRCVAALERDGYGLWAVEVSASGEFIGFVGLAVPTWHASFAPRTEIGWRLTSSAWGHGYATEAAHAALATAFGLVGLDEVVSFTTIGNLPSQNVMQRIGMTRDPSEDFDHPRVADGPLRRHALYRISRADWQRQEPGLGSGALP